MSLEGKTRRSISDLEISFFVHSNSCYYTLIRKHFQLYSHNTHVVYKVSMFILAIVDYCFIHLLTVDYCFYIMCVSLKGVCPNILHGHIDKYTISTHTYTRIFVRVISMCMHVYLGGINGKCI